jgi:hypothetical protein
VSRTNHRSGCPQGRQKCGCCTKADLNRTKLSRAPQITSDDEEEHICQVNECLFCGTKACGECVLSSGPCPHDVC